MWQTIIQKSVKYIKEEIEQLKSSNTDITERLKHIEEDINDETDDDCDSEIDLNLSRLKYKLPCKSSLEKKGQDLKCDKCDFVGDTELSISKHTNTRHPLQKTEDREINSTRIDCNLEGIEGIDDLFQLEVLHGAQIYACNVCDQGFDKEDEITKHIKEDHTDIMIKISEDMENKEDKS